MKTENCLFSTWHSMARINICCFGLKWGKINTKIVKAIKFLVLKQPAGGFKVCIHSSKECGSLTLLLQGHFV